MQPEVRDFDPHSSPFTGEDGFEVYRRPIPQSLTACVPDGLVALEIGFARSDAHVYTFGRME